MTRENEAAEKQKKAELDRIEKARKAKIRNTVLGLTSLLVVCIVVLFFTIIKPNMTYNDAKALMDNKKYTEAAELFDSISHHKDAEDQAKACYYSEAEIQLAGGNYEEAASLYSHLGDYKDAVEKWSECQYNMAIYLYNSQNYEDALLKFEEIDDYKDSASYIAQSLLTDCKYHWSYVDSLDEEKGTPSTVYGNTKIKELTDGLTAAYFDGDGDYIECGRGMNITDNWSFHTVICCEDVDREYSAFFAKYEVDYDGAYAFSVCEGRINIWITTDDGHEEIWSDYEVSNGEWLDVSVVKEGDVVKLYINGALDAEENIYDINTNDDMVTIGRQALFFDDDLQFKGYIAEISIFENALTENAIHSLAMNSLYDNGMPKYEMANALSWNGHRYALFSNMNSWEDAKAYCESIGGHLAVIESAEENVALFDYICSKGVENAYFGYSDSVEEDSWTWVDGSSSAYANWHSGEPNGESSNEDYAMFYYKFDDGTWNDGDFGGSTVNGGTTYICEWDQ